MSYGGLKLRPWHIVRVQKFLKQMHFTLDGDLDDNVQQFR